MTPHPKSVSPNATIRQAAELMSSNHRDSVFVVDAVGSLVGVITERDIAEFSEDKRVGEGMQPEYDTVTRDTTTDQATRLMESRHVTQLPVVEYGRLIGVYPASEPTPSQDLADTEVRYS